MLTVTVTLAVLVVSACGSDSRTAAVRPPPRLPRTVAVSLATRSDALAGALRRGDACAAKIQMHGLERQTRLAIRAGRIPRVYRDRLEAAVSRLAARMPLCAPPPPPVAPAPAPHTHAHGDHHKPKPPKKHGHGK
jgi:hypothetical protein